MAQLGIGLWLLSTRAMTVSTGVSRPVQRLSRPDNYAARIESRSLSSRLTVVRKLAGSIGLGSYALAPR